MIKVIQADITTLNVDAIVNAANETLLGGGGVDGAIHRAAGPRLLQACRAIAQVTPHVRCPTGEARITPGFDLQARYVIHTVGPVWDEHEADEARELLRSCYTRCFQLAAEHGVRSIAFPCIGAGVFGVPIRISAEVAIVAARRHTGGPGVGHVTLCCYSAEDTGVYLGMLGSDL